MYNCVKYCQKEIDNFGIEFTQNMLIFGKGCTVPSNKIITLSVHMISILQITGLITIILPFTIFDKIVGTK